MGEIILHGLHQLNARNKPSDLATRKSMQFYELGIEVDQDDFIACSLVQRDLVKGLGQRTGALLLSPESANESPTS